MNNKPTLLYVEDDNETMQNILFLLNNYFSKIYTAADGESALEEFSKNKPNMILLDINIPKLDGIEVAKEIRKTDKDTPILFLTAYSDKEKLMSAINLGTSAYIVKPLKLEELVNAINKIINNIGFSDEVVLNNGAIWQKDTNKILFKSKELTLTKKEIQLMNLLNENKQKFFTSCEISANLFNTSSDTEDISCNNSVQLLSRFKKKFITNFESEDFFIQNIYGVGYKLL